jgi:general stress protein YciG
MKQAWEEKCDETGKKGGTESHKASSFLLSSYLRKALLLGKGWKEEQRPPRN